MLQGPQLTLRWRILEWFEENLDSFLVLNFPAHGQHLRFLMACTKQPGCHRDGYLTGAWHLRAETDVPVVFSPIAYGGDGLTGKFGEERVPLGDVAVPFGVDVIFRHSRSNFSVQYGRKSCGSMYVWYMEMFVWILLDSVGW